MLAEATTSEISKKENPKTFSKSKNIAKRGGTIVGNTRKDIESQLEENIVTPKNAKNNILGLSKEHFKIEHKKEKTATSSGN